MRAAAARLGSMREGRKSIIFVSEGFTSTLPPQLTNESAALPGLGNRAQPGQDVTSQRAYGWTARVVPRGTSSYSEPSWRCHCG